jgi:hypothetical protein
MKGTKYFLLLVSVVLLGILPSCKINYSFSGASVAPDVKTVSIQYFKNNATLSPPTLSQSLTEALKDMFMSQTSLGIIDRNGDIRFEGEITGYLTAPVALQANDLSALNRLTITVNVRFENTKDEKQKFETSFSRFMDYPSTKPIASVQDDLIRQINEQLVLDIFNRSMVNW